MRQSFPSGREDSAAKTPEDRMQVRARARVARSEFVLNLRAASPLSPKATSIRYSIEHRSRRSITPKDDRAEASTQGGRKVGGREGRVRGRGRARKNCGLNVENCRRDRAEFSWINAPGLNCHVRGVVLFRYKPPVRCYFRATLHADVTGAAGASKEKKKKNGQSPPV